MKLSKQVEQIHFAYSHPETYRGREKLYVEELLHQQRTELIEQVEGMEKKPDHLVSEADALFGYNQALSDVLNLLKEE